MISVIVPVYNIELYIERCIRSILDQTYQQFELILVDDGSTDDSGKICDYYTQKDKRCRVIHQDNRGPSEARNTGLEECSPNSQYVTFIDGDDFVHPLYLECLLKAITGGDIDMAMCLLKYSPSQEVSPDPVDANFGVENISRELLFAGNFGRKSYGDKSLKIMPLMVVWGKLYKRNLVIGERFKRILTEDAEYNTRIYLKAKKTVLVDQYLYYYLRRPDSLTSISTSSVYYTRLFSIPAFRCCLSHIPMHEKKLRSFAVLRMYKAILSTRYNLGTDDRICKRYFTSLIRKTWPEFIINPHINALNKVVLGFFLQFPLAYRLYRKITAVKFRR